MSCHLPLINEGPKLNGLGNKLTQHVQGQQPLLRSQGSLRVMLARSCVSANEIVELSRGLVIMMHGALQVFLLLADARVTPDPDDVVTDVCASPLQY